MISHVGSWGLSPPASLLSSPLLLLTPSASAPSAASHGGSPCSSCCWALVPRPRASMTLQLECRVVCYRVISLTCLSRRAVSGRLWCWWRGVGKGWISGSGFLCDLHALRTRHTVMSETSAGSCLFEYVIRHRTHREQTQGSFFMLTLWLS